MGQKTSTAGAPGRIEAVRRFNRFHTRFVGALNEGLLASPYSLAQARVLYEIATMRRTGSVSAAELGRALSVDAGYLSRLIAGLVGQGLVTRTASEENRKRLLLDLTGAGEEAFVLLDTASAAEVAALLDRLPEAEQRQLVGAMARIERLLGDLPEPPAFILRDPVPGDLGIVVSRQAALYAQEYGWDWSFEALALGIAGEFVTRFDPARERCWIAESEGDIVGSVFIVRQDDETAKLRLLYVDASVRGLGLGRRLVDEAIRFARTKGYRRMRLWTNDILVSARRIYEAAGFVLIDEEPHHSFGHDLVGQTWELVL